MIHYSDISTWSVLLQSEGVVELSGAEHFDKADFVKFCQTIGQCNKPNKYFNDPEHPEIFRVTSEKVNGQPIGMFSNGDLGWHANGCSRAENRHICVVLYCVKSDGQVSTIWCNTRKAFLDLSEDEKNYLRDLEIRVGPKRGTFYHDDKEFEVLDAQISGWKDLVFQHPQFHVECCLFHHHFIMEIRRKSSGESVDVDSFVSLFEPKMIKPEYMNEFVFTPGKLIISDQLTTIHRRGPYTGERFLLRAATDYQGINEYFKSPT